MRDTSTARAATPAIQQSARCPACHEAGMRVFYEVPQVPSNSCILLSSADEARGYPKGDIRLAYCPRCGFISNIAYDARLTEYSGRYEETQGFSPTFNVFHERLARSLVERHDLRDKELIEIGCGKGEFLKLLCDLGNNRGLGFDPGYSEERGEALGADRFRVVRDFFSDAYADRSADFVACKMTLEHIADPLDFMSAAARTVRRPDGVAFVQVPEALRILRDCAFEDIYYEHCSYYTSGSLGRLFERLGLAVTDSAIAYGDQYLTVEGTPGEPAGLGSAAVAPDLDEITALAESFHDRTSRKIGDWSARLDTWRRSGKRAAVWGSGSKGVSFLTTVPGAAAAVQCAVDINPYRQGFFMPGTGHRIVAPQELRELGADVVIVMNRVYVPEIASALESMGLSPEIVAL